MYEENLLHQGGSPGHDLSIGVCTDNPGTLKDRKETRYFYFNTGWEKIVQNTLTI